MSLDAFFRPQGIAVIGASADFKKMPGRPIEFLRRHGYKGAIYPVNPKYESLNGIPCFPSIAALPDRVDLALISIANKDVIALARQCAERGIKAVTILSGGFSETGLAEGRQMEEDLRRVCETTGLRVCGPNAQGGANLFDNVIATYSVAADRPALVSGPVGLISQSGVFGGLLFSLAQETKQGIGLVISTGNELDVGFSECVRYMASDERVKLVAGYVESIKDSAQDFFGALEEAAKRGKPVVLLKTGRTERGLDAAASHTGALASGDDGYAAAFKRAGVVRANDDNELRDLITGFSAGRFPAGPRVAITSMSGGAATLLTDQCSDAGLDVVAQLCASTLQALKNMLPPIAGISNPIDVTAQMMAEPDLLARTAKALADDERVDIVIVFLGMCQVIQAPLVESLADMYASTNKPVLVTWLAGDPSVYAEMRSRGIPVFSDTRGCVAAARGLLEYAGMRRRRTETAASDGEATEALTRVRRVLTDWLDDYPGPVTEVQAKRLLRALDMPVPEGDIARSAQAAKAIAREIGLPVVMKLQSQTVQHKSDVGGVRVGVRSEEEVQEAFDSLMAIEPGADGVLVEAMAGGGAEIILGAKNHPVFGPMIMAGMGGIFTEVYKDVASRLAPITLSDAQEMLEELRGYPILRGMRGATPVDIETLKQLMVRVSVLAKAGEGRIGEMDLNPVRVLREGDGVQILDALIVKDTF
ncbi:MAG: acetate--CoA ligase family protein [Candidimonas sp.]